VFFLETIATTGFQAQFARSRAALYESSDLLAGVLCNFHEEPNNDSFILLCESQIAELD
jgi:hypothetical protein